MFLPNFSHPAPRVQVRENPVPLYAAIIEDLGQEDFVKVDGAACSHTALLTPAFLARLGLEPRQRVPGHEGSGPMSVMWCSRPCCGGNQMEDVHLIDHTQATAPTQHAS